MGTLTITGWGWARPSALGGAASIFDFGNILSEYNGGPLHLHDSWELASDWIAIREDYRFALMAKVKTDQRIAAGLTRANTKLRVAAGAI